MSDLDERLARLRALHDAGLLATWVHEDDHARARVTPLAAFAPEVVARGYDPAACPPDAMAPWLAHAIEMLGQVDATQWPVLVARFVSLAPRLVRLPALELDRLDYRSRAIALRSARRDGDGLEALAAIDAVLALLDDAARGVVADEARWGDARQTAWDAARASARGPDRTSARGAAAAFSAAARTPPDAIGAACSTALDALEGQEPAEGARLVGAWLDAWELACGLR
jgi:hypothetical protein